MDVKKAWLFLLFQPIVLFSYELGMPNVNTPSVLNRSSVEISIAHRFYGVATKDPLSSLLGMDTGANVSAGISYEIINKIEIGASYIRDLKEYTLGIGYSYSIPKIFLRGRADIEYYGYKNAATSKWTRNFLPQVTLQGIALDGQIKPIVNAGFDGGIKKLRLGLGLSATVLKDIGSYIKEVGVMFEYSPVLGDTAVPGSTKNCFALGFAARTHGHQFMLVAGNTYEIGAQQIMSGTSSNDLHLGFTIRRLFGE